MSREDRQKLAAQIADEPADTHVFKPHTEAQCRNCVHSHTTKFGGTNKTVRVCKRFPPISVIHPRDGQLITLAPIVEHGQWCWEFQHRDGFERAVEVAIANAN